MSRRIRLPVEAWPEADRRLWASLTAAGGPLDEVGDLARLRASTLDLIAVGYGRWLAWLAQSEPDALDEAPAERATTIRLAVWMDAHDQLAPSSRAMLLTATLRVVVAAAPEADWRGQRRLARVLHHSAGADNGGRKAGRVLSSVVLLDAGFRLAGALADAASNPFEAARLRRDGAMIAFLALLPVRVRAFAGLELGRSVLVEVDRIAIALSGEMTKTGTPWESRVPEALEPVLRAYIDCARPELMARAAPPHDRLWVNDRGRPYGGNYLSTRICGITKRLVGVPVPPHFFRDAAATTLARSSPDAAQLTRGLLGHASFRTAERHYNHARGIEAGRDYAALLTELKRGSKP